MLVLTSAHPHALLPTIRSRCQQIACDALADEAIARALVERRGVAPDQAHLVARLAAGSYGRALDLLDEDLARERSEVLHFIRHAVGGHPVAVARFLDDFSGARDREAAGRFLGLLLLWFRDALVMVRGGSVINVDQTEDLRRFVDRFADADLVGVILGLERAVFLLERNVYIKLVFWDITVLLRRLILRSA
jgi:DNA polymerase-3 subunit delta'